VFFSSFFLYYLMKRVSKKIIALLWISVRGVWSMSRWDCAGFASAIWE